MNQAVPRTAANDRGVEGRRDELGAHVGRHAPADDPAAPGVDDRGEVAGATPCRELCDVGDPEPVGAGGREVAVHEIGEGRGILGADRRPDEPPAMDTREMVPRHQPRDPLARDAEAGLGEVGMDTRNAVRPAAPGMGPPDLVRQLRVRAFPGGRTA